MNTRLADILVNPERASEIPTEAIPPLLAQLAAVQSALAARLLDAKNSDPRQPQSDWEDRLITVDEAATQLSFTSQYLYELIRKGLLPAIRQGKYLRIRLSDLSAWIDKHCERGLDKGLYRMYSSGYGRQRTPRNSKVSRPHTGANSGADRGHLKHGGQVGTRRGEDIRASLKTYPLARGIAKEGE